jgi:hypothetical protein
MEWFSILAKAQGDVYRSIARSSRLADQMRAAEDIHAVLVLDALQRDHGFTEKSADPARLQGIVDYLQIIQRGVARRELRLSRVRRVVRPRDDLPIGVAVKCDAERIF